MLDFPEYNMNKKEKKGANVQRGKKSLFHEDFIADQTWEEFEIKFYCFISFFL